MIPMSTQFNLYISVVLISILLLIITIVDVLSNRLITRKMKKYSIISCLLIAGSMIGECIGVLTNGANESLIILHEIVKVLEFCLAPAIGVAVAMAYGVVKRPEPAILIAAAQASFECIAAGYNWVFSIDSQNIYHRESMYYVYVIAFVVSVIYSLVCIIRSGMEYQTGVDSVLVLTMIMIIVGIGIQFVNSDIRIDYMCIALGNLLLYSRHYKMVLQVDAVTHLLNRRCYDANIGNLGSRAIVIYFDINKFKHVNDTYGHSVGDICLQNIAERINNVYGKYGLCYRIGGDEFCVILNSGFEIFEELNKQFLDDIDALHENDKRMPGVSLGYAYYDADNTHIRNVIEEADAMMYKNKMGGELK